MIRRAVDLFAGLGGFTLGAEMAGYDVVWAGNHWRLACDYHSTNHPRTAHACQDLKQFDWSLLPLFDTLLASPSCKGFTHARGKEKPHHDNERATAWAVVDCAEAHRPPRVVLENVPRFLKWILYPAWRLAMEALGYTVTPVIMDAADCGVPQHRERVFIICTLGPAPVLKLSQRAHVPAREIIEWQAGEWSRVVRKSRAARTLQCFRHGREHLGDRFLIPYYKTATKGRSVDRPVGTITTVERFAVVNGDRMRMMNVNEYRRAMSFPDCYRLPHDTKQAVHLLGNAVPPIMARDVLMALS